MLLLAHIAKYGPRNGTKNKVSFSIIHCYIYIYVCVCVCTYTIFYTIMHLYTIRMRFVSCQINEHKHFLELIFPHLFPEYKCLLANLTMASWMPFQAMRATYAFDCSYMYHRNRPIFRKVGGRHYLSYHGTDNLQIGTDRFPRYANVWFQGYRSYLPFDSIKMPAYYFNYTRRAWIRAPANVLRVTCIEDNNY